MLESRVDSLRRNLLAVMPSQRDIVTIMNTTKTWWAIWFDKPTMNGAENNQSSMVDLCFSSLATRSPSFIGRALMLIVTSLQQLPLDFDYSLLSLHSSTPDLIDQYFSMVSSLVTSNDELIGNADGLECLTLQGLFFCNAGKPRRAFLSFRRALEAAQLMGLHRGVRLPDTEFVPSSAERLNNLWWTIYEADRFIPSILGLPYGIANKHCNLETKTLEGRNVSQEQIYLRKICVIKTDIIDRNQASKVPGYAATQEIDEKLERLARTMSPSWWDMSNPIWPKDSTSLARRFHRAMVQFWHHEVESLLHLPFMLLSATEPRYSYNKAICLKASRKMIDLYLALRENFTGGFVCKVTDFQVFIATVIILLGLLQATVKDAGDQQHADDGDWHVIDRVISFLGNPKANIDESVATQGLKVLQRLTSIGRDNGRCGGSLRLAIPYFGTISIARGSKYQDAKVTQVNGTRKNHGPVDADGWGQNQIQNSRFASPPLDNSNQHQQHYVDEFSPPGDSFNIEFASNSAIPPFGATNLDSVLEDNIIPLDDLAAYQTLPEFDQDIWENWDFSVE